MRTAAGIAKNANACPADGLEAKSSETPIVIPKKLETGLRTNSAGIPYTLLLRIGVVGFPTFGLLM